MRKIIIASHHKLAAGLKDTLDYILGGVDNVVDISAYIDNKPVNETIDAVLEDLAASDEIIVFTDLLGGSVNQAFFSYLSRDHFHVITGVNLPVIMTIALQPNDTYLTDDMIQSAITEAREQLIYVNDFVAKLAIDDEDE